MIEALTDDDLIARVGGRFRLCSLIQRRLVQLMDGARPLIERDGRSDLEIAVEEIRRELITTTYADEPIGALGGSATALL